METGAQETAPGEGRRTAGMGSAWQWKRTKSAHVVSRALERSSAHTRVRRGRQRLSADSVSSLAQALLPQLLLSARPSCLGCVGVFGFAQLPNLCCCLLVVLSLGC